MYVVIHSHTVPIQAMRVLHMYLSTSLIMTMAGGKNKKYRYVGKIEVDNDDGLLDYI